MQSQMTSFTLVLKNMIYDLTFLIQPVMHVQFPGTMYLRLLLTIAHAWYFLVSDWAALHCDRTIQKSSLSFSTVNLEHVHARRSYRHLTIYMSPVCLSCRRSVSLLSRCKCLAIARWAVLSVVHPVSDSVGVNECRSIGQSQLSEITLTVLESERTHIFTKICIFLLHSCKNRPFCLACCKDMQQLHTQ